VIKASSGQPLLQTILTIDPPEFVIPGTPPRPVPPAIPEPPSLLAFLLAIGGLALHRHRSVRIRGRG